ncbi:MAG: molybdopterin-dependent oxidoreductase, partial [bacterium]
MTQRHYAICPICQAACGLSVELEGNRVTRVRGHREDPLSRGFVCPKGIAIGDLHTDPDRVRTPLRREGDRWVEVSWEAALDESAERIAALQRRWGRDAAGLYVGNPTAHNHATLLFLLPFIGVLGSRNYYTSNSLDALPRLLSAQLVFGSPLLLPIPDIDRTEHLLIVGGNPVVSGGSVMTSPGVAQRLKGIRARGGRVVVVDPRYTETAALADEHHFIRPGADGLLLAALVEVLFAEWRVDVG